MSLKYRYRLQSYPQPVPSLGGRWVRPRPVLAVALLGLRGTAVRDALLDTGADDTLFPEALAAQIGLDLSQAPRATSVGVGAGVVTIRYATVALRVTDGKEQRQWQAQVGFTPARLIFPVLGFAGFLQYFTATFRGDREEVELATNSLYPGT